MATEQSESQPGKIWFYTVKKSFADVQIDETNQHIDTSDFLDATESLLPLFDKIGGGTALVKADLSRNVQKARGRQLKTPGLSKSIQSLVDNEMKEMAGQGLTPKEYSGAETAAQGLWWLLRGLDFTAQALRRSIEEESETLTKNFQDAYKTSLGLVHTKGIKLTLTMAFYAIPARKNFYVQLGGDENLAGEPAKIKKAMVPWLEALEKQVAILISFQKTKGTPWDPTLDKKG